MLIKSRKPGWLSFLPDGSCYNAYLSSVDIKEDAKKKAVFPTVFLLLKNARSRTANMISALHMQRKTKICMILRFAGQIKV